MSTLQREAAEFLQQLALTVVQMAPAQVEYWQWAMDEGIELIFKPEKISLWMDGIMAAELSLTPKQIAEGRELVSRVKLRMGPSEN